MCMPLCLCSCGYNPSSHCSKIPEVDIGLCHGLLDAGEEKI